SRGSLEWIAGGLPAVVPWSAERRSLLRACRGPLLSSPLFLRLENGQKRFLRNLDRAYLLHALLAFLLLLQQLPFPGDVPTVAFREDVFAHRGDGFPGNDSRADRCLDSHLIHLARDDLLELGADVTSSLVRPIAMDDYRGRINENPVDQDVHLDEFRSGVAGQLIVQRAIAAADRLELVKKVEDDLGKRDVVGNLNSLAAASQVFEVPLYPSSVLTK